MGLHEANRLEHFSNAETIPATARSLAGVGLPGHDPFCEVLNTMSVSLRFNEDTDPAPMIVVNTHGGPGDDDTDHGLRIDEAVLIYNALGQAIINACNGTRLSPKRITAFYRQERE
ncbi:hypothetical protein [Mycobacterium asiaticum]|uniref:hypothetical protein n=1 Tax=Mycobacterium asiaticum TaxID=1790 RepID=UPI0007F040FF|nr:hypothetical protein [Mycobacterium asiaticum]OBI92088.1 hypothetical protein A5661_26395 [Mycobacterium asiaticum]